MMSQSYTTVEAAKILGVPRRALLRWRDQGKIKASKLGGRTIVFDEIELIRFRNSGIKD